MKYLLSIALLFVSSVCFAQKYETIGYVIGNSNGGLTVHWIITPEQMIPAPGDVLKVRPWNGVSFSSPVLEYSGQIMYLENQRDFRLPARIMRPVGLYGN